MELLYPQMIVNLKSRFFELFDIDDGYLDYEQLLDELLISIKHVTDCKEVAFFSCNEWNQQLIFEASTNAEWNKLPRNPFITCKGLKESVAYKIVNRSPKSYVGFEPFDLLLHLQKDSKWMGFLAIKDNDRNAVSQLDDELLKEISKECSLFIKKAQSFTQVLSEEKRYKELFRVTEKFHSSMDMDAVLGEIIFSLKKVYPSFTYFLLLSHDNNNHGNLPIKDLQYDSENIAAMQAYVTGTIQFEDLVQEKRSILYAPLKGKQGVYGVLQVIAPNTLMFPKSEVEFIMLLANTAGSALENAQLYQQSKRLVADLQLINETSHRLNSNLRLTETMTFMCEQITKSFQAEAVGFILISDDYEKTTVLSGSSEFFQTRDAKIYISYIKEKLKVELDSIFIGDLHLENEFVQIQFRSIMAIPMVQTGFIGFALVMHREPYYFSFETFKLLQSLIHHSTLAFTNTMLREELEKMVVTDHLTKLYSRNYLDKRIHQSMEQDSEGTFILIDIDNFKSINDTYGHQIGDEVLIQVANVIMSNIRETDIGTRWGGEELAIYLPNAPLSIGISIAERLRIKVAESTNPHVTISCGVSYWSKKNEDTFTEIFNRADEALYVAKETGKNKVVVQKDSE